MVGLYEFEDSCSNIKNLAFHAVCTKYHSAKREAQWLGLRVGDQSRWSDAWYMAEWNMQHSNRPATYSGVNLTALTTILTAL